MASQTIKVIRLPRPSILQVRPNPPKTSPPLPYDVLLEIASYLPFRDLISLSLVSKGVHDALPLRITTVVCDCQDDVIALHHYIFPPGEECKPERALHLRSLQVENLSLSAVPPDMLHLEHTLSKPLDIAEFVFDVMWKAEHLEKIHLGDFYAYYVDASKCDTDTTLNDLPKLLHLRFDQLTTNITRHFPLYPNSLRTLHLSVYWADMQPIMLRSLLRNIAHHSLECLETLILEDIMFLCPQHAVPGEDEDVDDTEVPVLASVREFNLYGTWVRMPASFVAACFPNLKSLCLDKNAGTNGFTSTSYMFEEAEGGSGPTVAPLHSLTVSYASYCLKRQHAEDIGPTSGVVDPWKPDRLFFVTNGPVFNFFDVGDSSALVGITMRVPRLTATVWHEVLDPFSSGMRWIELESIVTDFTSLSDVLMNDVLVERPPSFCASVISFSVLAPHSEPREPWHTEVRGPWLMSDEDLTNKEEPTDNEESTRNEESTDNAQLANDERSTDIEQATDVEESVDDEQSTDDDKSTDNEQLNDDFVARVSRYFPSLRYVALAACERVVCDCKVDYAGNRAPWRWWKIRRDEKGLPVEAEEIPAWEGERVRQYLRDADLKAMNRFDDGFVALR